MNHEVIIKLEFRELNRTASYSYYCSLLFSPISITIKFGFSAFQLARVRLFMVKIAK